MQGHGALNVALTAGALTGPLAEELQHRLAADEALQPGTLVGPYRILDELGRGGMAVVYRAERADHAFDQRVAVKLIKRGTDTDEVLSRFRQERQILASLTHPNIARLLDGGATREGRPYFAMELVEGEPIDAYCRRHRLDLDARLDLCVAVARAVHHAHRHLVVHRDLKPSNILVTNEGEPKLLDFGIAKLLDPAANDHVSTRTALRLMTPDYASPEQVRGEAITTASDVYQLGLLIFEILTGRRAQSVKGLAPAEAQRLICEQEPPRPSAVDAVALEGEVATDLRRFSKARRLRRRLRSDLDHVVMKALSKEPSRRYGSVEHLVEDLLRSQRGLPVTARGSSWRYHAAKFMKRHWAAVTAALTMMALVGGLVSFYSVRLAAERDRAREAEVRARDEAQAAGQVTSFLMNLFKVADPGVARGSEATAREILDRGLAQIRSELADQPGLRARLLDTIGDVYQNLGVLDEAAAAFEDAVRIRKTQPSQNGLQLAGSLNGLARVYLAQARYREVEAIVDEALASAERVAPGSVDVAKILSTRAALDAATGRFAEAETLHKRAIAAAHEALGTRHPDVAVMLEALASLYINLGRYSDATALYEQSLEINRESRGADHPASIANLASLGRAYRLEGRYGEAVAALEQAIQLQERVLGSHHVQVARTLMNLVGLYFTEGRLDKAEPLAKRNVEVFQAALGPAHPDVAKAHANLGSVYHKQGRFLEAEQATARALAILETALGSEHPDLAVSLSNLSAMNRHLGRMARAESLQRRAVEIRRKTLGPRHPDLAWSLRGLGEIFRESGRLREAEQQFRIVVQIREEALGPKHSDLGTALNSLGDVLLRMGRVTEAGAHFERAGGILQEALDGSPDLASSLHGLAAVRLRQRRYDESEPLFKRSLAILSGKLPPAHPDLIAVRNDYARLLRAMGRKADIAVVPEP